MYPIHHVDHIDLPWPGWSESPRFQVSMEMVKSERGKECSKEDFQSSCHGSHEVIDNWNNGRIRNRSAEGFNYFINCFLPCFLLNAGCIWMYLYEWQIPQLERKRSYPVRSGRWWASLSCTGWSEIICSCTFASGPEQEIPRFIGESHTRTRK